MRGDFRLRTSRAIPCNVLAIPAHSPLRNRRTELGISRAGSSRDSRSGGKIMQGIVRIRRARGRAPAAGRAQPAAQQDLLAEHCCAMPHDVRSRAGIRRTACLSLGTGAGPASPGRREWHSPHRTACHAGRPAAGAPRRQPGRQRRRGELQDSGHRGVRSLAVRQRPGLIRPGQPAGAAGASSSSQARTAASCWPRTGGGA
jgi:hypothetical protein